MEVRRLNRDSEDFYARLGPVFGSRLVENETHDRFFDDPGKEWYFVQGRGAASIAGCTIKNFWATDTETANALTASFRQDYRYLEGIVPGSHEEVFIQMGFKTQKYKKNFIEVWYERD